MDTLRLGDDIETSRIAYGCMTLGGLDRQADVAAAIDAALDGGITLFDHADIYGRGRSEEVFGRVLADRPGLREHVVLQSKCGIRFADDPPGAPARYDLSYEHIVRSAEGSLRRLGTDRLDLYLLHWPSRHPIEATLEGFDELRRRGLIGHAGVSNFDLGELRRALLAPGGGELACNQILYGLARRWAEWELATWCEDRGIAVMAYTPLERGRILGHPALERVARRRGASPAQVALAWCLRRPRTVVIPKAGDPRHVRDNAGAVELFLSGDDLVEIDDAFPPPDGPAPLEIL